MVQTWIAQITPLYEEGCYQRYYEQLPRIRKEKADRLRSIQARAQSVGAWSLLQEVRNRNTTTKETAFNLSHSGDYVLCSISSEHEHLAAEKPVHLGCDIQQRKGFPLQLARRYFCESEYQTILSSGVEKTQRETFFRYWVLKESFMKATRQGIRLPMNQFEIELGNPPRLIRKPEMFSRNYIYHEYVIDEIPYQIAVCSTDEEIEDVIHTDISFGV